MPLMTTAAGSTKSELDGRLAICAAKYVRLRRLTFDQLEEEALRAFRLKVVVRSIGDDALDAVDRWSGRRCKFPWRNIRRVLHTSHPDRLELSLWVEGELCGLAAARLSDAKEWVSLTFVEGSPRSSHPLKRKVAPIALVGADIYASLIQHESGLAKKPEIRILNPLPESMVWYRQCGYTELRHANGYSFACKFSGDLT